MRILLQKPNLTLNSLGKKINLYFILFIQGQKIYMFFFKQKEITAKLAYLCQLYYICTLKEQN